MTDDRAKTLNVRNWGAALGVTRRTVVPGGLVYAFYGHVEHAALKHNVKTALVLGYVLAHELAHVVLATSSHGSWGLMRPAWEDNEYLLAAARQLSFSNSEAEWIRTAIRSHERDRCQR